MHTWYKIKQSEIHKMIYVYATHTSFYVLYLL